MLGGPQSGKALAIDTPIPTPSGFRPLADITFGDTVFDDQGRPCRVTGYTGVMADHECYRVTFDNGATLIADAQHQWTVHSRTNRKHGSASHVLTTEQISKHVEDGRGAANYSIPLSKPVKFPKRELPIPPYVMGAWLGDGFSKSARICSADEEIMDEIRSEGILVGVGKVVANQGKAKTYQLGDGHHKNCRNVFTSDGTFTGTLRDLDVYQNKHIPRIYLTASIEQRKALLQGLMDTDGYCAQNGTCEFSTIKPMIAYDFVTLLASLSIKGRLATKRAMCSGKDCGITYRVTFTTNITAFRLQRKQRQHKWVRPDVKRWFIRAIEKIDSVPVKCIAVDSPSSLYLAGHHCIPTHNTSFAPVLLWQVIQHTAKFGEGNDYLAVEATYDLFKLKMLPELLEVFVRTLGVGRYWAEDKVIELAENLVPGKFKANRGVDPMWGRIILRSADSKTGLESATVKAAWLDEFGLAEYTRETWEAVQRRLSLHLGCCLITTTIYAAGWKDIALQGLVKSGDGVIIPVASVDNPAFPREEYERQRRLLPTWKFNMVYRGIISKPAGLVYSCFEKNLDVVARRVIPFEWPIYVGQDFGTANPAAVFLAQDPHSGKLTLFAEYKPGAGQGPADNVREMKEIVRGRRIATIRGGSHQEEESRDAYRQRGWAIMEPPPTGLNVKAGIAHVFALLAEHKVEVFDDNTNWLDEVMSYGYALDKEGNPCEDIDEKAKYHLMDATRYILSVIRPDTVVDSEDIATVTEMRPSANIKLRASAIQDWRRRA